MTARDVKRRSPASSIAEIPRELLAICVVVAILVALPVGVTIVQAFQGGLSAISDALSASSTPSLLVHTVLLAVVATPAAGVVGLAGAWFVERTQLPGRRVWALLLVAPLTVPLFVTSYAWATLGTPLQGFWGAAAIVAFSYYPIIFLLVAVALRGLDPALEETARSLGLNARQTFFRVVLPQLRPALLGGMLLVALDALVEFDAFVALKFRTFSSDVYAQYRLGFSVSGAAALSFFSIVLCLLLLFGEARLRGNVNYTRVSQGARRAATRYDLGRWLLPVLAGLGFVVAVSVGIPIAMLIKWFSESSSAALSMAAANTRYLFPASVTSIELGLCAAALAIVFAFPIAILAVRHSGPVVTVLERVTYLSFALPDIVAAIALSYAASHYLPSSTAASRCSSSRRRSSSPRSRSSRSGPRSDRSNPRSRIRRDRSARARSRRSGGSRCRSRAPGSSPRRCSSSPSCSVTSRPPRCCCRSICTRSAPSSRPTARPWPSPPRRPLPPC